jgi:hypothetical protein
MEEVLDNPGFEILRLFDDDPWIKTISEVYDKPHEYFGRSSYISYRTQDLDLLGRAALLSPNCDGNTLSNLLRNMPIGSIKRVVKNKNVKTKLKSIIEENYTTGVILLDMESLFNAWDAEIINNLELAEYISKTGGVGSMSCRKRVYLKVIRKLNKEFIEKRTHESFRALINILLFSRSICHNWFSYEMTQENLVVLAEALKLAKKLVKKTRNSDSTRGGAPYLTTIKDLSGLILKLIWETKPYPITDKRLEEFYNEVNKLNLSHHEWGNSKQTWPPLRLDLSASEEVDKLPIQIKAFYARGKCFGEWFHVTRSDTKSRIIEEVNNWLYERGGVENLLYNSISVRKIIALDESIVIP